MQDAGALLAGVRDSVLGPVPLLRLHLQHAHENFLHQVIDEPTYYRGLQNPTLIDLILTNDSNFVHSVEHNPPFGKSHHSVISFCLDIEPPHTTPTTTVKSMVDKGDYESMRDFVYKEDSHQVLHL